MYPVPTVVADWLRKPYREFAVKALVNDVEYGDDVIVDFSIENSLSLSDELELGTVIPNKLTIRFRMYSEFPPNAKIVPYIALKSDNLTWEEADMAWKDADIPWEGGTTDWIPLGEFYVDNRTKDRDIWTYVCYDRLIFADMPYVSQLNYPTSMQAVWDEICTQVGFEYGDSVVIDPSYTIPAGPAGFTCRQVMGFIAAANSACVYMDKEGVVQFRRISAAVAPVFEMTESDYIRVQQTNPVKTYSRVVVIVDDEGNFYEAGSGPEAETLYILNPFGTQAMANKILTQINGFSYVPISMPAKGFPHLDQGDIISFETVESMAWEDADIAWQDADFRWDGVKEYQTIILHQVLDFRGGLSMQIEAPSISEQKSEFPVEGTLTEAINRLNRDALKFGKPYYGITHSREHGFVVQREDGKSKITLNSDVMDWQVDGVSALHYDALAGKLRFRGDIIMEGGTINWNNVNSDPQTTDAQNKIQQIVNGTYTGGTFISGNQIYSPNIYGGSISIGSGNNIFRADSAGIWAGHANFNNAPFSVDMSGHMKAVGGEFSGTISASTINGGTITGATITGGIITGAVIQTSPSPPNIVLSGNELRAYSNASTYMSYSPDAGVSGPGIRWYSMSSLKMYFGFVGDGTLLQSQGKLYLTGYDGIQLQTNGNVMVWGWNQIYDYVTGQTLQQVLNSLQNSIAALWTALDGKADKNHVHTVNITGHNHGIAPGTMLATVGGGGVTFSAWPGGTFSTSTPL